MILLIGGIFIGFITILAWSSLGWFALIPGLGAIVLIAAGIQNLVSGRPEEALEAMNELQRRGPNLGQRTNADSSEARKGQSKID